MRCTINDKVCNLIVDGGSYETVVAANVVKKLGLKIEQHPHPYNTWWIHKGQSETKVTQTCFVQFCIDGKYFDEAQCDMIDMAICHLPLRRL